MSHFSLGFLTLPQDGGGGLPAPAFSWEPEVAETPPGSVSFTRATTARVLTTTDGATNWYQEAKAGEIRYEGLRRVENSIPNVDLTTWTSLGGGTTVTVTSQPTSGPDGGQAYRLEASFASPGFALLNRSINVLANSGKKVAFSIWMRSNNESSQNITLQSIAGQSDTSVTVTTTWQRFVVVGTPGTSRAAIGLWTNADPNTSMDILVASEDGRFPQYEQIQELTDAPSEINGISTTYNANVPGVRYFATTNGNSVDGNGVVTEAAGSAITGGGYLPEPASTNFVPDVSLTSGTWTNSGANPSSNGVNSLGLEEFELDVGTSSGEKRVRVNLGPTTTGTAYIIAKQGTHQFVSLRRGAGGTTDYAVFDLSDGSVSETGSGVEDADAINLGPVCPSMPRSVRSQQLPHLPHRDIRLYSDAERRRINRRYVA